MGPPDTIQTLDNVDSGILEYVPKVHVVLDVLADVALQDNGRVLGHGQSDLDVDHDLDHLDHDLDHLDCVEAEDLDLLAAVVVEQVAPGAVPVVVASALAVDCAMAAADLFLHPLQVPKKCRHLQHQRKRIPCRS